MRSKNRVAIGSGQGTGALAPRGLRRLVAFYGVKRCCVASEGSGQRERGVGLSVCLRGATREAREAGDDGDELRWLDGFGHMHREARVQHAAAVFRASVRRQRSGREVSALVGGELSDALNEIVAVEQWHGDIRDQDVGDVVGERTHGFVDATGEAYLASAVFQDCFDQQPRVFFVVDHQYPQAAKLRGALEAGFEADLARVTRRGNCRDARCSRDRETHREGGAAVVSVAVRCDSPRHGARPVAS